MTPLHAMHLVCASGSTFSSLEDVRQSHQDDEEHLNLLPRNSTAYRASLDMTGQPSLLHRLPYELVAYVYSFLGLRDLLNVTWVCSRWRQIALDQATLWSKELLLFPRATSYLLDRSGYSPLEVAVEMDWGNATSTDIFRHSMASVFRHIFRFRHLTIIGPSDRNRQTLQTLGVNHAPILESFAIECLGGDILILDSGIFRGSMPYLRTLTANNVKIPFTSPLFSPSLRHLTISFFRYSDEYQYFYSELLVALEGLRLLETFRLFLTSSVPLPSLDRSTVNMPYLQTLCLQGGAHQNRWLWDHIQVPSLRHICLETVMDSETALQTQCHFVIPNMFRTSHGVPSLLPLQTLRVVVGHNQIAITAWNQIFHPVSAPLPSTTRERHTASLNFTFPLAMPTSPLSSPDDVDMNKIAASLIPRLPVSSVSVLHLQTPIECRFPSMFISTPLSSPGFSMIPSFSSLEHLILQNDTVIRPFFDWFLPQLRHHDALHTQTHSEANDDSGNGTLPLPTLRHIVFVSGTFLPGSAMGSRQVCRALARYAAARRKEGSMLETVETVRCHLDSEWVDTMKPLVSSLIVNGKLVSP